jgi:tetratricopeptide (TPR) repeat protein
MNRHSIEIIACSLLEHKYALQENENAIRQIDPEALGEKGPDSTIAKIFCYIRSNFTQEKELRHLLEKRIELLKPDLADLFYHRARLYFKGDHLDEALNDVAEALAINSHHSLAYCLRAEIYLKMKQWIMAKQDLANALLIDPNHITALNLMAVGYAREAHFAQAIKYFSKVIEMMTAQPNVIHSELALAFSNRGCCHYQQCNLAAALPDLDKAILLDPNQAQALASRADIYQQFKKFPEATADCQRALSLNPNSAIALTVDGQDKLMKGLFQEALISLTQAQQIKPTNSRVYKSLGEAHFRLGNFEAALINLNQAINLSPHDTLALLMRVHVYWQQQKLALAYTDLISILLIDPHQEDALTLIAKPDFEPLAKYREEFKKCLKTCSQANFSDAEINHLIRFLEEKKEIYKDQHAYLRAQETGLSRTVEFFPSGAIFIHFNCLSYGDMLVGQGTSKKAKFSIAYPSLEIFIRTTASDTSLQRQELSFLSRLKHIEHVAKIYYTTIFKSKKLHYFKRQNLMPFYRGGTLEQAIRNKDPRLNMQIGLTLLKTLARIHNLGIIHRDIKPLNIFLTEDFVPIIGDFGDAANLGEFTKQVGTWDYMAPELSACHRELVSRKSDVYSMGKVLSYLNSSQNKDLHRLCKKMTAFDPQKRPYINAALACYEEMIKSSTNAGI